MSAQQRSLFFLAHIFSFTFISIVIYTFIHKTELSAFVVVVTKFAGKKVESNREMRKEENRSTKIIKL